MSATTPPQWSDTELIDDLISFDSISLNEGIDSSPELISQTDQNILHDRNAAVPSVLTEVSSSKLVLG